MGCEEDENTDMTLRKPLEELWQLITTIGTAIVFTVISFGTLLVIGFILSLPIVAVLLMYQHLF